MKTLKRSADVTKVSKHAQATRRGLALARHLFSSNIHLSVRLTLDKLLIPPVFINEALGIASCWIKI